MSIYAIKNSKGDWLGANSIVIAEWTNDLALATKYFHKKDADYDAKRYGAKAVPLGEKCAPVVVSAEEAEMLDEAKTAINPMHVLWMNELVHNGDREGQNRLMRAYVIGWVVEKPKRYLVRVPHANRHYYYQKCDSGEVIPVWDMETEPPTQFTEAEIEHYELGDCERVEVTDDEE